MSYLLQCQALHKDAEIKRLRGIKEKRMTAMEKMVGDLKYYKKQDKDQSYMIELREDEITVLHGRLDNANAVVDDLQSDLDQRDQRIKELEGLLKKAGIQEGIENHEQDIQDGAQAIEELEGLLEAADHQKSVNDLKQQVEDRDKSIVDLKEQLENHQSLYHELNTDKSEQIEELEERLDEAVYEHREEVNNYKAKLLGRREYIKWLNLQLAARDQRIAALEQDRAGGDREITQLNFQFAKWNCFLNRVLTGVCNCDLCDLQDED